MPLIGQVTCVHRLPLLEVLRGRVVLVDGTLVPIGNRRTDRATHPRRPRLPGHRRDPALATGYRGRLTELPNLIRIITTLEYYRLGW